MITIKLAFLLLLGSLSFHSFTQENRNDTINFYDQSGRLLKKYTEKDSLGFLTQYYDNGTPKEKLTFKKIKFSSRDTTFISIKTFFPSGEIRKIHLEKQIEVFNEKGRRVLLIPNPKTPFSREIRYREELSNIFSHDYNKKIKTKKTDTLFSSYKLTTDHYSKEVFDTIYLYKSKLFRYAFSGDGQYNFPFDNYDYIENMGQKFDNGIKKYQKINDSVFVYSLYNHSTDTIAKEVFEMTKSTEPRIFEHSFYHHGELQNKYVKNYDKNLFYNILYFTKVQRDSTVYNCTSYVHPNSQISHSGFQKYSFTKDNELWKYEVSFNAVNQNGLQNDSLKSLYERYVEGVRVEQKLTFKDGKEKTKNWNLIGDLIHVGEAHKSKYLSPFHHDQVEVLLPSLKFSGQYAKMCESPNFLAVSNAIIHKKTKAECFKNISNVPKEKNRDAQIKDLVEYKDQLFGIYDFGVISIYNFSSDSAFSFSTHVDNKYYELEPLSDVGNDIYFFEDNVIYKADKRMLLDKGKLAFVDSMQIGEEVFSYVERFKNDPAHQDYIEKYFKTYNGLSVVLSEVRSESPGQFVIANRFVYDFNENTKKEILPAPAYYSGGVYYHYDLDTNENNQFNLKDVIVFEPNSNRYIKPDLSDIKLLVQPSLKDPSSHYELYFYMIKDSLFFSALQIGSASDGMNYALFGKTTWCLDQYQNNLVSDIKLNGLVSGWRQYSPEFSESYTPNSYQQRLRNLFTKQSLFHFSIDDSNYRVINLKDCSINLIRERLDYFGEKIEPSIDLVDLELMKLSQDTRYRVLSKADLIKEFHEMVSPWPVENKRLFSEGYFWNGDKQNPKERIVQFSVTNLGLIFYTPEYYYMALSGAESGIHFQKNLEIYPLEQFDLKYNRPDIILDRLGYADSSLVQAYHKAYQKRLKKMGFTEDMLEDDFHLPEIKIENFEEIEKFMDHSSIDLRLKMEDSKYNLDRINIWINDVAIYGTKGISLRDQSVREYSTTIPIELANGKNKIQVSVLNQAGAESYKETIEVKYQVKDEKPNLYLITLGASQFKQTNYNLTYAAKDANDVILQVAKSEVYEEVFTKTLTNEELTKENVIQLKPFLEDAGINDHVMVFLAGHGVLSADLDYYLATYDMDFNQPKQKGLMYEDLEGLLDGIKPLKKVLFIDACHSGEIDKEEVEFAQAKNTEEGDVRFRAVGKKVQSKLGAQNTLELTKSLFTDLRKGTGATVISSAGGMEFAMESGDWKNGLFTYALLNGIKSRDADLNKDGEIWLSELQEYVGEKVTLMSNGLQRPTSRIENQMMDFRIW